MGLVIGASIDTYDFHVLSPQLRLSNIAMTPSHPGVCTPAAGYHKLLVHTTVFIRSSGADGASVLSVPAWAAPRNSGSAGPAGRLPHRLCAVYDNWLTVANVSRGASNDTV